MTQEEFYLKAMLALASNPNYVEVKQSEDDPTVTTHVLLTEEIEMDAERLLIEAKNSWVEAFDKPDNGTNDHLKAISQAVAELNEQGILTFPQEQ